MTEQEIKKLIQDSIKVSNLKEANEVLAKASEEVEAYERGERKYYTVFDMLKIASAVTNITIRTPDLILNSIRK